ncbi:MAG: DUF4957 domain-containing protein [Odoribacteraceae bacterium]|nr:DUF4957 domain-containing protein [Odoribacteraceae bacterium]
MKKIYKNMLIATGIPAALLFAACSDNIDPVVESLDFSRLMSPVGTEVRVVNRNSVRLNWSPVRGAEAYVVEFSEDSLLFSPVARTENVTADDLPVTFTLAGETRYSVRVKAIAGGIAESKWFAATFKTDAENIFYPVDLHDVEATLVTLRWPAGSVVTDLIIQPGDVTRPLEAVEKENGYATITGLTGETAYTVVLKNGAKTRGTLSFTTLIDLGGAIQVNPADNLEALVEGASDGDIFALMPGTYAVNADILVSRSISIKGARPTDKPVITGAILKPNGTASLQLKDIVFDGTGSDGNQMIVYEGGGTTGELKIADCEIKNYVKGTLYVNTATLVESLAITGCVYTNVECNGGDFIDFRNGLARSFVFTGNTVNNCATGRDLFRMDAGGSTNFPGETSTITITNNTFYKAASGSSKRLLYVRLANHSILFNKNIIALSQGIYTNQAATTVTELKNNNYFEAPNYVTTGNVQDVPANGYTTLDPGFANATAGDFTVSNETLIENGIGDPRWLP